MRNLFLGLTMLCSIGLMTSCNNAPATDSKLSNFDELQKEIMSVHDEVMPKLGKINQLSSKLKSLADQNAEVEGTVQPVLSALKSAESGMMDWMQGYKTSFEGMEPDAVASYLAEEKTKVDGVANAINSSISKASELVSQLEAAPKVEADTEETTEKE